MILKKIAATVVPAFALSLAASNTAHAELIYNGNFETTSAVNYRLFYSNTSGATVSNWTSTGYNFIYGPQSGTTSGTAADNAGATGEYTGQSHGHSTYDNVKLWGPGTHAPSSNHLTLSPVGGNFIASDPNYDPSGHNNPFSSISQTINNLNIGTQYQLTFYWAGAQQSGYTGDTTQQWQVKLGNDSQYTSPVNLSSKGFSGWMQASMTFTATGTSELLQFISHATPTDTGLPPFLLLDGVSMNPAVPEPSSMLLLGAGVLGMGVVGVRRRRRAAGSTSA